MKKFKILSVLTLILLIVSCSPVKRLDRFQKRNPHLFQSIKDTVTVKDTARTTIEGSRVDTVFNFTRLLDTVYIDNGISHTTIYQNNDSIFFHNRVDTLFVAVPYEKEVIVDRYKVQEPTETFWNSNVFKWIVLIVVICLIFATFRFLLK